MNDTKAHQASQFPDQIQKLQNLINASRHLVFFGGAGVSTESGIPDFRSAQGINQGPQSSEEILTLDFLRTQPEVYYRFYRPLFMVEGIKPNIVHQKLSLWEEELRLDGIITQNVDGLHQLAGSQKVVELHGNGHDFYCLDCGRSYTIKMVREMPLVPRCQSCKGLIRPAIVHYGEGLDDEVMDEALHLLRNADLVIVGGTSLVVYPAAGFLNYLRRAVPIVLINKDSTSYDHRADLLMNCSLGDVFRELE